LPLWFLGGKSTINDGDVTLVVNDASVNAMKPATDESLCCTVFVLVVAAKKLWGTADNFANFPNLDVVRANWLQISSNSA
jgi:hypothetical protein